MKRFIDLRNQGTQCRFAWWDTVTDAFEKFDGEMAWDTWGEFAEVASIGGVDLERYRSLTPPWVHLPLDGTEEDKFWGLPTGDLR
jgi:hypothetical protein